MSKSSYILNTEPKWQANHLGLRHYIPSVVQSWIYETGSLTQRLRDSVGGQLKVSVLFHDWHKPFIGEARILCLAHRHKTLVREVLLSVADQALVLARTIIPVETLKGEQRHLSKLGNRPLGEVIFSYPKLQRLAMDCSCVKKHCWSNNIKQQLGIDQPIWGRRTVYAIKGQKILVNEFFLPQLIDRLI